MNKPGQPTAQSIQQEYYQSQNNNEPQYDQDEEGQQNYDEEYQGDEEQEMKNQQIIMFWEHKFYTIL